MKVQNTAEARSRASVVALNALIRQIVDAESTYPHYEATGVTVGDFSNPSVTTLQVVSSSTADLAAVKTMANECQKVLYAHFTDANAHKLADSTNAALIAVTTLVPLVTADSQGTTDTFINTLVTAYGAHRTQSGIHSHDDSTNLITASTAVDLASSKLVVADVKAQTNAHISLSWPTPSIELV